MGAAPTSPARVQSGRPRSRRSRDLAAASQRHSWDHNPEPQPSGPAGERSQLCLSLRPRRPPLLSTDQLGQVLNIPGAQTRGRAWRLGALLDRMLLQTLSPEPHLTLMATAVHPKTLLGKVISGQAPTSHPRHLRQPQPLCSLEGCSLGAALESKEVETGFRAWGLAVCSRSYGRGSALNPISGSWA